MDPLNLIPLGTLTGLTTKPSIVVPGDDEGNLYFVVADNDSDPTDWTYTTTEAAEIDGTADSAEIQDVDSDGDNEIFVTAYDEGCVHVYRVY